jgi:hypothetical protein
MPALVAGIHVLAPLQIRDVDGRNKSGHDVCGVSTNRIRRLGKISESSPAAFAVGARMLGAYSAGWLRFANVRLRLSHNSILAPFRCMMTLCCSTESVLFQAQ